MKLHTLPRTRAAILGVATMLTMLIGIPLIVAAQDATPEATPASAGDPLLVRGEEIFNTVCIACHQPDGKGIEGIFLPLAGNPLVTLEDPTYLITVILNGRGGMPRFDTTYSDEDIASIATFVRQNWENDAPAVTAEQVAAVRASFEVQDEQTPEGQIPEGSGRATPEATPEATPAA
jgi:cytochrome c oxidase cbb3-type subunit 2